MSDGDNRQDGQAVNPTVEHFNNLKHVDYKGVDNSGRQKMYGRIQHLQDTGARGFLLLVGIDRLSFFNEAFGVKYADSLIEETGSKIEKLLGHEAFVTRIYGDVFGALVTSAREGAMAAVAQDILSAFYEDPLQTEMGPIRIGVSVGGIILSHKDISPATAIAKAGFALRTAKEQGRGRFIAYEETTSKTQNYRSMLVTGDTFLKALKENRIHLAFQPVMDSKTGGVSFHECLVRMVSKGGQIVNAADFIPAVEELGLARLVDRYTFYAAINELSKYSQLKLSVNVSNWSLSDNVWVKNIVGMLKAKPDVAPRLIIEITESAAMHDIKKTRDFIKSMKDLGCRIALDDFGVGYTAFAQLKNLDVDIVKIDKSYIRNLTEDSNQLFVRALNALAQGIEIETVGEGAETVLEADMLRRDGINHIQGFVYGEPLMERLWLPADHADRYVTYENSLMQPVEVVTTREKELADRN